MTKMAQSTCLVDRCTRDADCKACGPEYSCDGYNFFAKGRCVKPPPPTGICSGAFDEQGKQCVEKSNRCLNGTEPSLSPVDCSCFCVYPDGSPNSVCVDDNNCKSGMCTCGRKCGPVQEGEHCAKDSDCETGKCVAAISSINCAGVCAPA